MANPISRARSKVRGQLSQTLTISKQFLFLEICCLSCSFWNSQMFSFWLPYWNTSTPSGIFSLSLRGLPVHIDYTLALFSRLKSLGPSYNLSCNDISNSLFAQSVSAFLLSDSFFSFWSFTNIVSLSVFFIDAPLVLFKALLSCPVC